MFNLTIESLKELTMTKKRENNESNISLTDLPTLIEILDEAERSISRSINQWNV
jgi:PII-like signaling protein